MRGMLISARVRLGVGLGVGIWLFLVGWGVFFLLVG